MQTLILKSGNLYIIEREKYDLYGIYPNIFYLYRSTFIGRFKLVKRSKKYGFYVYAPALDRRDLEDESN